MVGSKVPSFKPCNPKTPEPFCVLEGLAIDASDNILVAGHTGGTIIGANAGADDIYVMKLDTNGDRLWQHQYGSTATDHVMICDVDAVGDLYVAGQTNGNLLSSGHTGGDDIFLLKLLGASGTVSYIRRAASVGNEWTETLKVTADAVLLGGRTNSAWGSYSNQGLEDAVLVKWDLAGTFQWNVQFGTSAFDSVDGIIADESGGIIVAGNTMGSMGGTCGSYGGVDWYLMGFDHQGAQQWSAQMGSNTSDDLRGFAADAAGNLFLGGFTSGVLNQSNSGLNDVAVIKAGRGGACRLLESSWLSSLRFKHSCRASASGGEARMGRAVRQHRVRCPLRHGHHGSQRSPSGW